MRGPRSWQALVDDPSKYTSNYFTCRSKTITSRDIRDLSSIYYPRAFTGNRYAEHLYEGFELGRGRQIWRFEIVIPPADSKPSNTAVPPDVCSAERGATYTYNAYAWVILHRAKGSSGAWRALRKDTAGTTLLTDGDLAFFKRSDLDSPITERGLAAPSGKLVEFINPVNFDLPSSRPRDCVFVAVNVDLREAAYASIRDHEFVVVGLTRGDPRVNAGNLDGTSRSNILLDLGDGAKQWTLGQPSAPMTFPGSS